MPELGRVEQGDISRETEKKFPTLDGRQIVEVRRQGFVPGQIRCDREGHRREDQDQVCFGQNRFRSEMECSRITPNQDRIQGGR